jgi:hypothetical protein
VAEFDTLLVSIVERSTFEASVPDTQFGNTAAKAYTRQPDFPSSVASNRSGQRWYSGAHLEPRAPKSDNSNTFGLARSLRRS